MSDPSLFSSKEKVPGAVLDSFIDEYQPGCELHRMLVELRELRASHEPPADELLDIVREVSTMDCFYSGASCDSPDCKCLSARASRAIVPRASQPLPVDRPDLREEAHEAVNDAIFDVLGDDNQSLAEAIVQALVEGNLLAGGPYSTATKRDGQ